MTSKILLNESIKLYLNEYFVFFHLGRAPKGHYQVIIEVARAIVLVLGLSVIFAFVHLVLAYSEEVSESQHDTSLQENTDIENTGDDDDTTISNTSKHK